jgi:hypothetical protein
MNGVIEARLAPRDEAERRKAVDAGHDLDRVLRTDDLVTGDNTYFVATGITDGELLRGVRYTAQGVETESIVMRSLSSAARSVRYGASAPSRGLLTVLPAQLRRSSSCVPCALVGSTRTGLGCLQQPLGIPSGARPLSHSVAGSCRSAAWALSRAVQLVELSDGPARPACGPALYSSWRGQGAPSGGGVTGGLLPPTSNLPPTHRECVGSKFEGRGFEDRANVPRPAAPSPGQLVLQP